MNKYIERFPQQLEEAILLTKKFQYTTAQAFQNILICGMGGSAIGGEFVADCIAGDSKIPLYINKDYKIPAFAGENTLVICSSYSGDTAETLSAFEKARNKKCKIICVSSGGELLSVAQKKNTPFIEIPGGMPPRAGFAYSCVALFVILIRAGIISENYIQKIKQAAHVLSLRKTDIKYKAKELAEKIVISVPAIYTAHAMQSVALRWKQQLNENAKTLAYCNAIPEMNHNEILAYETENKNVSVLFLRNSTDDESMQKRFDVTKQLIMPNVNGVYEIYSEGGNFIERSFYLIHYGDWFSYYLAKLKNIDAIKIDLINHLKQSLKEKK